MIKQIKQECVGCARDCIVIPQVRAHSHTHTRLPPFQTPYIQLKMIFNYFNTLRLSQSYHNLDSHNLALGVKI